MHTKLIQILNRRTELYNLYYRMQGAGFLKRVERFFLLKHKYLYFVLAKKKWVGSLIPTKTFFGTTFFTNILDGSNATLYYFGILGAHESALTSFFIQNLKTSDIFYDIGASYGFYSVLASQCMSVKETHCFEPSETSFVSLSKNVISKNTLIFLNRCAVSDYNGIISYYDNHGGGHSMLGTTKKEVANFNTGEGTYAKEFFVPSVTLDTYVLSHTPPTVLKIDVEGGEYAVLRGAESFFINNKPIIALEVLNLGKAKKFSENAVVFLLSCGFEVHRIQEKTGELLKIRVQKDAVLHSLFPDKKITFDNFIFKKK